jgi:2-amino-4-hydroxy-6-hydroxymethyldihydropteridine diphosphokinase
VQEAHVIVTKPAICGVKAQQISVSYTRTRKFRVALALGSNDTLAQQQIISAIEILGEYVSDIQIGGFYKTSPVGYTQQNDFVNTALIGYVNLRPEELFGKIKTIEKLMGKHEIFINGPRCIDIDLTLFDNLVYTHNFLTVPHKSMHLRDFVLKPLADIDGSWVHPVENKSINELLNQLKNVSILNKIEYYK